MSPSERRRARHIGTYGASSSSRADTRVPTQNAGYATAATVGLRASFCAVPAEHDGSVTGRLRLSNIPAQVITRLLPRTLTGDPALNQRTPESA
jgi:hypothetical protein